MVQLRKTLTAVTFFLRIFSIVIATNACIANIVRSQLIPDRTLGPESSTVTPNLEIKGIPSERIEGGAIRDRNLFHSFQEFNVGAGRGVYFANPGTIENILTRVTGGNSSNILGTLGVLGNANLFLINPNGIFFGSEARLDVGGSFFAATAGSLIFNNGFEFSADNPQALPLLAINIPMGLGFRDNSGTIVNQSAGISNPQTFAIAGGLQVPDGKTLALIGGNVQLQGGLLVAPDGFIELGGLATAGIVGIDNDRLVFPDRTQRADVSLTNGANVSVTGRGRGSIAIAARNLDIVASSLNAGILPGFRWDGTPPGSIKIDATGTVSLNKSRVETDVKPGGIGDAGAIAIRTGSLLLSNEAIILSGVRTGEGSYAPGQGNGGNIAIDARDRVVLSGNNTAIWTNIGGGAIGNSGKIRITVTEGSLSLADQARLRTGTSGDGNAGKIAIAARDSVTLSNGSIIAAEVGNGARGNGGDINLAAASVSMSDRAQLKSTTAGVGNAGSINVEARDFVALSNNSSIAAEVDSGAIGNGGNIVVNVARGSLSLSNGAAFVARVQKADATAPDRYPAAEGNGGSISVTARESVSLERGSSFFTTVGEGVRGGRSGNIAIAARSLLLSSGGRVTSATSGSRKPDPDGTTSVAGNISVQVRDRVSLINNDTSINAAVNEKGEGASGGDIRIDARSISVGNGAQISASSQTGSSATLGNNAGQIVLNADIIRLDEGSIEADTQAGKRASITLEGSGLLLRRNSNITTNADNTNGGNIRINTGVLVGLENSDITANARNGGGGAIAVQAQGIFGSQSQTRQQVEAQLTGDRLQNPRFSQLLSTSDIIAISQTDPTLSGTVTLTTPDVDPTSGLVELPQDVVDPAALIAQNPCDRGRASEFTITGKGGLPANPSQSLNNDEARVGLVEPAVPANTVSNTEKKQSVGEVFSFNIMPARGWIRNEKGEVILVGYDPSDRGASRQRLNLGICRPR